MPQRILFLTLKVFSAMGGIEKVSRVAGKALMELGAENAGAVEVWSMYDKATDVQEGYIPAAHFRGFSGDRRRFVIQSIRKGRTAGLVILSHINLLTIGYAIKKLSPATKLVLIAHGIEVWEPLPSWKRSMLRACDRILPVSRFTREKMLALYGLDAGKLAVVNNCLDPFLPAVTGEGKRPDLLSRYGLSEDHKILFTLTRLSSAERYKGYDEVIMALKALKKEDPAYKYLIVGKWDGAEKQRLDKLIAQQGLTGEVIFGGFVPDEEVADHFNLADIYIMPSRGEGFGIVFIEALYYGKPVIAGNRDGSADALAGGQFGVLVNPSDPAKIIEAIRSVQRNREAFRPERAEVQRHFSFFVYKKAIGQVIASLLPPQAIVKGPIRNNETLVATLTSDTTTTIPSLKSPS